MKFVSYANYILEHLSELLIDLCGRCEKQHYLEQFLIKFQHTLK